MTSATTNSTTRPAISLADEIIIKSSSDLLSNTTYIDANTRRCFPMVHYRFSESILADDQNPINFTLQSFGQTELHCLTAVAETYVNIGSNTVFKNYPSSGGITSFSDNGSGGTTVTLSSYRVAPKMLVRIAGNAAYNGDYEVKKRSDTDRKLGDLTFDIDVAYTVAAVGGETVTILNEQFVINNLNVVWQSGVKLLEMKDQDLIFLTTSYFQGGDLGDISSKIFYVDNCAFGAIPTLGNPEVAGYVNGFKVENIGDCDYIRVVNNEIVSDKSGNKIFLDLNTHTPVFNKMTFKDNELSLATTDHFIDATSASSENLTANGKASASGNSNINGINTLINGVSAPTSMKWAFLDNTATLDTKKQLLASENASSALSTVGNNTYGAISLDGIVLDSVTQQWGLTNAASGIFTYKGKEDFTGLLTATICGSKTGNTEFYRFIIAKNGSFPLFTSSGYAPLEVKNSVLSVTLVSPISVSTDDTIQIAIAGAGHSDSITLSDISVSIL
jgi:hypothetical protein